MHAAWSPLARTGRYLALYGLLVATASSVGCTDETPLGTPQTQGNSGADAGEQPATPGAPGANNEDGSPPATPPPGATPTGQPNNGGGDGDGDNQVPSADAGTPGDAGLGDASEDAGPGAAGDDAGNDESDDAGAPEPPLSAHCGPPGTYGSPLPAGSLTATTIAGGPAFLFLEGPVWLPKAGVLLFSEMDFGGATGNGPPSKIHRFSPPSTFDVFVAASGSNGLALDLDGDVLAGTHDQQTVSAFTYPAGNRSTVAAEPPGAATAFNSPNDLTIRSDGTIYFSDPSWQRDGRAGTGAVTGVYRRAPSGVISLEDDGLNRPNGITLSPDEGSLYVSAADGNVYRYAVASDGRIAGRGLFASPGSGDGMTVDCAGNVYLAAGVGKVFVYRPDGSELGTIDTAPSTTNVAFGGPDRRTLFVTADAALQSIVLNIPGLPF